MFRQMKQGQLVFLKFTDRIVSVNTGMGRLTKCKKIPCRLYCDWGFRRTQKLVYMICQGYVL